MLHHRSQRRRLVKEGHRAIEILMISTGERLSIVRSIDEGLDYCRGEVKGQGVYFIQIRTDKMKPQTPRSCQDRPNHSEDIRSRV